MTLRVSHDVGAATWVVSRIFQRGRLTATDLVPDVFEAYARIFHPVFASTGESAPQPLVLRWSEIARRAGTPLSASTGWAGLANPSYRDARERTAELSQHDLQDIVNASYSDEGIREAKPPEGSLEQSECESLAEALADFTTTPDSCWFALWPGYGMLPPYDDVPLALAPPDDPIREYVLFRGPVNAVDQFWFMDGLVYQSPTMWWPDDRAWFVHTEVDLSSTFVGGTTDCIRAILSSDEIEAMEINPADELDL